VAKRLRGFALTSGANRQRRRNPCRLCCCVGGRHHGCGSVKPIPILGAIFVTLLPIATRWFLESFGGLIFYQADLANIIPNLRLILFGGLIIFFLVVEPDGLNRLWRNIRNYFRVWPFSY